MKRFIGFDLGDGESAVALLNQESDIEPRILALDGSGSFLSAVAMQGSRIVVGNAAATMDDVANLRVRFKSRFLTETAEASRSLSLFARGVAQHLAAQDCLQDAVVTVGCPAGWTSLYREAYQRLLQDAGFEQVHVVSESRAAFIYAKYAKDVAVDPALFQKSVLVVDIGSSTLDFAYIVGGKETGIDTFGDTHLGGGILDACILERAVADSPDAAALRQVFAESAGWRCYCELAARRLKEQYFSNESLYVSHPCEDLVTVYYDGRQKLHLSLDKESVQDLLDYPQETLGQRSFRRCLQDALENARRQTAQEPPQLIMLTGGASRMEFFRALCRDTFPEAVLVCCPEPEYSVARGLAYVGRVDERMAQFRQAVREFTGGSEVEELVRADLPLLLPKVSDALADLILREAALPLVQLWRKGSIRTLNEMNELMQKKIATLLASPQAQACMAEPITEWTQGLCEHLQGKVNSICDTYDVPHGAMDLSRVHASAQATLDFSFESTAGMDIAGTLVSAVVAVICGMLCGGAETALVATGPVGFFAGAIVGSLASLLGWEKIKDLAAEKEIPHALRQVVRDKNVTSSEQQKKLSRELMDAFSAQDSDFSATLVASVSQELDACLNRMAEAAEIPIQL